MLWPPRTAVASIAGLTLAASAQPAVVSTGPVLLGAAETRVEIAATTLAQAHGASLAVVLSSLSTDRPPGVLYLVAVAGPGTPQRLGYINFFDAGAADGRSFTFRLTSGTDLRHGLTLTITPAGPPDPAAHPRIGRIEIVNHPRP